MYVHILESSSTHTYISYISSLSCNHYTVKRHPSTISHRSREIFLIVPQQYIHCRREEHEELFGHSARETRYRNAATNILPPRWNDTTVVVETSTFTGTSTIVTIIIIIMSPWTTASLAWLHRPTRAIGDIEALPTVFNHQGIW
jgi:hypothetical protein